jgi:hypothetical protein
MADAADVRSIDTVREWHASLAEYGDGLAEALAGVEMEIRRAFEWLNEQGARWQRAVREREEEVVRAKAELSQRKFPNWDGRMPDCSVQEKALRLARARLEHAEDQVEKCRAWVGKLPKLIDEVYRGASRRLSNFLEVDLRKGLADLGQRLAALESYASLRADYAPTPLASSVTAAPAQPAAVTPAGDEAGKANSANSASPPANDQSQPEAGKG